jgi:thiamine pyrophosphate-dependent acetolactate synthase large subunit-like protein
VTTLGELLAQGFALAGVEAFYGEPFEGLDVVPAPRAIAGLLAAAHERVHGETAAVHRGAGAFVIGDMAAESAPQSAANTALQLDDPADAPALFAHLAARVGQASTNPGDPVTLDVRLAPGAPVTTRVGWHAPAPMDRFAEPPEDLLERLQGAQTPVLIAGPAVLRRHCAPGLHALAAAANLGVLNTWGAKGLFDWRSRHHWATVGLQQRDLELGGLGRVPAHEPADLVVTTGLDPAETPPDIAAFAPVVTVAPEELSRLSEVWSRPAAPLPVPPLRAGLAAVTQQGWARTGLPLAPSQVTRNYASCTAGRGLVAADPGTAGFWVARTFATTVAGEALVPGRADTDGLAVACAMVARLRSPHRAVLAAVDAPVTDSVRELLEHARSLGVPVVVEAWDPDGDTLDADRHLERLTEALWAPSSTVLTLAADPTQLDAMEEVAGPVVAWRAATSRGARS